MPGLGLLLTALHLSPVESQLKKRKKCIFIYFISQIKPFQFIKIKLKNDQISSFRLRLDGCQDVSSLQTTVPGAAWLSKPDPAAKVCVSYLRGGADTTVGAAVLLLSLRVRWQH